MNTVAIKRMSTAEFLAWAEAQDRGRFELIEHIELLALAERGVVGDIVGDPHELIEREDGAAMARVDQPRRDREVLVPVPLAGP